MSVKFSAPWKKFLFLYRLAIFSPSSTRKLYGRELYFCALFRFRKIICANCVPSQLKTLARFRSYPVKTIIRKIRRPSVPLRFLGSLRRYSWFPLPRKKSSPLCLLRTLAPHAQNFALCPTEKVFPLRFVLPFRCTPDVQNSAQIQSLGISFFRPALPSLPNKLCSRTGSANSFRLESSLLCLYYSTFFRFVNTFFENF